MPSSRASHCRRPCWSDIAAQEEPDRRLKRFPQTCQFEMTPPIERVDDMRQRMALISSGRNRPDIDPFPVPCCDRRQLFEDAATQRYRRLVAGPTGRRFAPRRPTARRRWLAITAPGRRAAPRAGAARRRPPVSSAARRCTNRRDRRTASICARARSFIRLRGRPASIARPCVGDRPQPAIRPVRERRPQLRRRTSPRWVTRARRAEPRVKRASAQAGDASHSRWEFGAAGEKRLPILRHSAA